MEAGQRQQLNAAKFRALLKSLLSVDASSCDPDPNFNRGVAFTLNGSAWIYVTNDPARALGACLAWVESRLPDAREVNIVVDSDNLEPNKTIAIKATESRWVPVRVQIPDGIEKSGSHKIMFRIESEETHEIVREKSTFIVPRN